MIKILLLSLLNVLERPAAVVLDTESATDLLSDAIAYAKHELAREDVELPADLDTLSAYEIELELAELTGIYNGAEVSAEVVRLCENATVGV